MKTRRRISGGAIVGTLLCLMVIPASAQTLTFRGIALNASPQTFIDKLGAPDKITHLIAYLDYADAPDKVPTNGARGIGDTDYKWNSMSVAGYDAAVVLELWKGRPLAATYLIQVTKDANSQEQLRNYVNSYNDLLEKLTKLYGLPKTKEQPGRLGSGPFSVLLGSEIINLAPYASTWNFENGEITLFLSLDAKTSQGSLSIAYWAKWAMDELKAIKQKKEGNTNGL